MLHLLMLCFLGDSSANPLLPNRHLNQAVHIAPIAVQRIGDRIAVRVSKEALGKPMLWFIQLDGPETSNGYTVRSCNSIQVRWELRKDNLELISTNPKRSNPLETEDHVVKAFAIASRTDSDSISADVTDILYGKVPAFSPAWTLQSTGFDLDRTRVLQLINDRDGFHTAIHTVFQRSDGPGIAGDVLTSLVLLPEKPLSRIGPDPRIGYITSKCPSGECIRRFRLLKQHPEQPISRPVKPIVFEISQEIPNRWRPYIRRAVENWNAAFQQSGFVGAVECRVAPTLTSDPTWNPADLHRNVIRWSKGTGENATGYSIPDPRSGESICAKVVIGEKVIDLFSRQYFVQVSGAGKPPNVWPLPEAIQGRILQYVVEHELGHVFGLDHNSLASSVFSVANLRDQGFTDRYGDVASVMSYGRFNYVAQPSDGCPSIPILGAYDRFALRYAYEPGAANQPDRFFAPLKARPDLRYGESGPSNQPSDDPDTQWDKVGRETLLATELGVRNLRRVSENLNALPTSARNLLGDAVCTQWETELGHVVGLIGGIRGAQAVSGPPGPVSRSEQLGAIGFVGDHIVNDIACLEGMSPTGCNRAVENVLTNLFDSRRVKRMANAQTISFAELFKKIGDAITSQGPSSKADFLSNAYEKTLTRVILNRDLPSECRNEAKQAIARLDRELLGRAGNDRSKVPSRA